MQITTQALVIKVTDVGENDRLLTLLTKHNGIIKAFASNAKKINNKYYSATSLFCFSDFTLRDVKGSYRVSDATLQHSFFKIGSDVEILSLCQYFCEVAEALCPPDLDSEELQRLILNIFHFMKKNFLMIRRPPRSTQAITLFPSRRSSDLLDFGWDEIAAITSRTPLLTDIVPNGNKTCIELYQAGGIPALMKELTALLNTQVTTVTGKTLAQDLESAENKDLSTIRTVEAPLAKADGIQVLYGNVAPQGALVKTSAVPEALRSFRGTAKVFNNEDACYEAFHRNEIVSGDVVVIRYEGPKGGPGMKEMHRVTEILKQIPGTAVITDGRFSGASGGLSIGYICPEAAECGPIALLETGDIIEVELAENRIHACVSEAEFARRAESWKPHIQPGVTNFLARYAASVGSSRTGAIVK